MPSSVIITHYFFLLIFQGAMGKRIIGEGTVWLAPMVWAWIGSSGGQYHDNLFL
jgi:hypothetical protein